MKLKFRQRPSVFATEIPKEPDEIKIFHSNKLSRKKKSTEEAKKAKSDAFWLNKNVNVFDDVSCLIGNNRKEPVSLDDGVA